MKINFSPYFNGKTYIDYSQRGGLLNESVDSTAGMLARLELICGLSWPEEADEHKRSVAYFEALDKVIDSADPLYTSFVIDREETRDNAEADRILRVTTELLKWRDNLLLAGWDGVAQLPGKLALLNKAEQQLAADSYVRSGVADRWNEVGKRSAMLKNTGLEIELHCPTQLIPAAIIRVIAPYVTNLETNRFDKPAELKKEHIRILETDEQTDAYLWIACQPVGEKELVVCDDGERLDSSLRYCGSPEAVEHPQAKSHRVVNDVRCMLNPPKSLIWLDCQGDLSQGYPYAFLSKEEQESLNEIEGIVIPDKELQTTLYTQHIVHLLNDIEKVTLLCPRLDLGTKVVEHPIASMLKYGAEGEAVVTPEPISVELAKKECGMQMRFTPSSSYQLPDGTGVDISGRRMSYSSLDSLIQYPFNYVVERVLNMKQGGTADSVTENGIVAHKVVELMAERSTDKQLHMTDFDDCLAEAIQGTMLASEENFFNLQSYTFTLRNSVAALADIIRQQDLEIEGCEMGYTGQLDTFGETIAKIDCVLKDKRTANSYVIFDFKYSSGDYYPNKLKENDSVQFEIYRQCFDKISKLGKIVAYGYYLFPKATLYVPEGAMGSDRLSGEGIEKVGLDDNALDHPYVRLSNSYTYRSEQLSKGLIEEGEGQELAGLDYSCAMADKELFPLSQEYKNPKNKGYSYGTPHKVLKNKIR